ALSRYVTGVSARVRREHAAAVIGHCGWSTCGKGDWKLLRDWLLSRALERDNASLLLGQALEHLRAEKIVRPGLDRLMRAVASAGESAHEEIYWRLRPQLTAERCELFDAVVITDAKLRVAPLVWLGDGATSWAPESIVDEIVQMFDQALAGTDSRARKAVAARQQAIAKANVERLGLLDEILDVVLDPDLDDAGAGAGVRGLGTDRLSAAVRSEDERVPRDGGP